MRKVSCQSLEVVNPATAQKNDKYLVIFHHTIDPCKSKPGQVCGHIDFDVNNNITSSMMWKNQIFSLIATWSVLGPIDEAMIADASAKIDTFRDSLRNLMDSARSYDSRCNEEKGWALYFKFMEVGRLAARLHQTMHELFNRMAEELPLQETTETQSWVIELFHVTNNKYTEARNVRNVELIDQAILHLKQLARKKKVAWNIHERLDASKEAIYAVLQRADEIAASDEEVIRSFTNDLRSVAAICQSQNYYSSEEMRRVDRLLRELPRQRYDVYLKLLSNPDIIEAAVAINNSLCSGEWNEADEACRIAIDELTSNLVIMDHGHQPSPMQVAEDEFSHAMMSLEEGLRSVITIALSIDSDCMTVSDLVNSSTRVQSHINRAKYALQFLKKNGLPDRIRDAIGQLFVSGGLCLLQTNVINECQQLNSLVKELHGALSSHSHEMGTAAIVSHTEKLSKFIEELQSRKVSQNDLPRYAEELFMSWDLPVDDVVNFVKLHKVEVVEQLLKEVDRLSGLPIWRNFMKKQRSSSLAAKLQKAYDSIRVACAEDDRSIDEIVALLEGDKQKRKKRNPESNHRAEQVKREMMKLSELFKSFAENQGSFRDKSKVSELLGQFHCGWLSSELDVIERQCGAAEVTKLRGWIKSVLTGTSWKRFHERLLADANLFLKACIIDEHEQLLELLN